MILLLLKLIIEVNSLLLIRLLHRISCRKWWSHISYAGRSWRKHISSAANILLSPKVLSINNVKIVSLIISVSRHIVILWKLLLIHHIFLFLAVIRRKNPHTLTWLLEIKQIFIFDLLFFSSFFLLQHLLCNYFWLLPYSLLILL